MLPPRRREQGDRAHTRAGTRWGIGLTADQRAFRSPSGLLRIPAFVCSFCLELKTERTQPFTAPAVTPSMNWFWARKNTTSEGTMEMSDTAITRFQLKPVSASIDIRTNSVAG